MRAALVIALCAAGCFSDRGVAIEVDVGDSGATSVELYIGESACDKTNAAGITCTTIAPPPDGRFPLRGEIWFRDAPQPYTAAVKGRTATFTVKADTDTTLPIIIAVGTVPADPGGVRGVGTATLTDLAIPIHSARVVTTALVAANPVVPGQGPDGTATEDRVLIWRKMTPPSSCVVVEHWANGQATRAFVVPGSDPDCDDVVPECNPASYRGTSAVGGADGQPDCLATDPGGACVLGGFGCADLGPRTGTCLPQHRQVCVPSQFCGCDLDPACLQGRIDGAPAIPRIECFVPVAADLSVCRGLEGDVDLGDHYLTGDCGQQPLLGSLQAQMFGNSLMFNGAELEISSVSAPCKIAITSKGGTHAILPVDDDHGVVRLETSNGALLVPIIFRFRMDICATAQLMCMQMGDAGNTLWSCAR